MNMALISAENVGFVYSDSGFSLNNINLQFSSGSFCSVIGRNGSGKSTLVRILAGIFNSYSGSVNYLGRDIRTINRKEYARNTAFLPQINTAHGINSDVAGFLHTARYPHKKFADFRSDSADTDAVESALSLLGISELREKSFNSLSGGERQKVLLALPLVQLDLNSGLENKVLIVDEPLTYLDINYQFEIFSVLAKLNKDRGLTVISVIHDLNMAIKYTDTSVLLEGGNVISSGMAKDVISEDMLKKHFEIDSRISGKEDGFNINFIPSTKN